MLPLSYRPRFYEAAFKSYKMLNRNLLFIFFFQPILSLAQKRIDSQSGSVSEIIAALGMEARFIPVRLKKIVEIPGWINVMDTDFNLYHKTAAVSSTWLVKKPTVDGLEHSLEIFDSAGGMLQLAEQFIK